MKNQQRKTRKASWKILDLAFLIQFPARHYAAKLVLLALAKGVNCGGKTYPGYDTIMKYASINSRTTVSNALKFLRDEYQILTWLHGNGGEQDKDTNDYRLDVRAMFELVKTQGLFDPATGKKLRDDDQSSPANGLDQAPVESSEWTRQESQSSPLKTPVESSQALSRVQPLDTNPLRTTL